MAQRAWQQRREAVASLSPYWEPAGDERWRYTRFLFSFQSGSPVHGMVPPTRRASLFSQLNVSLNTVTVNGQSRVSMASLSPIKLTIDINHHISVKCPSPSFFLDPDGNTCAGLQTWIRNYIKLRPKAPGSVRAVPFLFILPLNKTQPVVECSVHIAFFIHPVAEGRQINPDLSIPFFNQSFSSALVNISMYLPTRFLKAKNTLVINTYFIIQHEIKHIESVEVFEPSQ